MVYIIDIDNTCADMSERIKKAGNIPDRKDRAAFQQWLDKAHDPSILHLDKPIEPIRKILLGLQKQIDTKLYYLTGRSEAQREETEKWLKTNKFPQAPVLMRKDDDWRGPHRYKSEQLKNLMDMHEGESFCALDDDYAGDCEPMYRNRDILFLKVVG